MYSVQLEIRICLHKHTRALKKHSYFCTQALQKIHLSPGTQGIKHSTRIDANMSHQRERQQTKKFKLQRRRQKEKRYSVFVDFNNIIIILFENMI